MQKVLITRYWTGDAYKRMENKYQVEYNDQIDEMDRKTLMEKMRDADAVISMGDELDEEMIAAAPKLKVIADMWWGGRVDKKAAEKRGIPVLTHHQGMAWLHSAEVEHLFMLVLAVNRRIREADAFVRAGKFVRMEQANREMLGYGLKGHTLGVIGGTRWTGAEITRRANAFEMSTVYWDHGNLSSEMQSAGAKAVSLDELLQTADVIMMVVQNGYKSGYVLDKAQFDRMKPGMVIANVTNGDMINEKELVQAIRSGRVRGAGLDKLEHVTIPAEGLMELPTVVLTPHSDGAIYSARASLFEELVEGVDAVLSGKEKEERA